MFQKIEPFSVEITAGVKTSIKSSKPQQLKTSGRGEYKTYGRELEPLTKIQYIK